MWLLHPVAYLTIEIQIKQLQVYGKTENLKTLSED